MVAVIQPQTERAMAMEGGLVMKSGNSFGFSSVFSYLCNLNPCDTQPWCEGACVIHDVLSNY